MPGQRRARRAVAYHVAPETPAVRVSDATHDAPLAALLLPFDGGALAWPAQGTVAFLRARDGWPLRRFPLGRLACEQGFRPLADALAGAGLQVQPRLETGAASLVLVLPPRQRDEARALLARAVGLAAPGARVVAAVANDEGARPRERELQQLAGLDGSLAKHHCRVFWTPPLHGAHDAALAAAWREADAPRTVHDARSGRTFLSRPGVFAWDRVDPASALLAAHLPAELAGRGADLAAGWGYLAGEVLARAPGVRALDLYEAEARALDLARANLAGAAAALGFHWHDVAAGLPQGGYDFIVSNPPFHAHDRGDRPELGQRFIEVAARALRPGGRLLLVANRHLPYEATLGHAFAQVRVLAGDGGFKAIEALRGRG